MPCSPHQRIRSRSSSASIENSCCSESTCRIAWHRSRSSRSKLDTPDAPDLAGRDQLAIAPQVSSIGTPDSSGQCSWYRSITSMPRRSSEASQAARTWSGRNPVPPSEGATFVATTSSSRRPTSALATMPLRDARAVDLGGVDPGDPGVEGGVVGAHDVLVGRVRAPGVAALPPTRRVRSPRYPGPFDPSRRVRMWRYNHVPVKRVRGQYAVYSTAIRPIDEERPARRHPMSKTVEEREHVVVRFAGDSGDGMQLTGDRFTSATALDRQRPRDPAGLPGGDPCPGRHRPRGFRVPDPVRLHATSPRPAITPTCWWR